MYWYQKRTIQTNKKQLFIELIHNVSSEETYTKQKGINFGCGVWCELHLILLCALRMRWGQNPL